MLCLNVLSEPNTEFKISVYSSYHKAGKPGPGEPLQTTTTPNMVHILICDWSHPLSEVKLQGH